VKHRGRAWNGASSARNVSVAVRPRRCRCVAIVTQLGTQIGAGEWVRDADRRRIAARCQEAAVYALGTWAKIEWLTGLTPPRPAHPVGGWAGGGFDFLIEVRSVQGLCGSVPARFRPCAIQHAGEQQPRQVHKRGDVQLDRGHVSHQVPFRGESATAADASVVQRTSTGRLRAPAARANTRRTSETGLLNTAGFGKIVCVTSAVVTGAIALSG
jgi:hypothetical protein